MRKITSYIIRANQQIKFLLVYIPVISVKILKGCAYPSTIYQK